LLSQAAEFGQLKVTERINFTTIILLLFPVRMPIILFFFLSLGCSGTGEPSVKGGIRIAVAANMQFAAEELVATFRDQASPEISIVPGSSGKLTHQLIQGAPFHLFLSADTLYPERLVAAGVAAGPPTVYAQGRLVLWARGEEKRGETLFGLLAEETSGKIAIPNPATAPYGYQARRALENAGLWEKVAPRLVIGESVAQATQYVQSGNCLLGFTSRSVVMAPALRGKVRWEEVPAELYSPIRQALVATRWGKADQPKLTEAFLRFMASDTAATILRRHGYDLP